jgi:hypothetical protein
LEVLVRRPRDFLSKKKIKFFSDVIFLILIMKTLDPDLNTDWYSA